MTMTIFEQLNELLAKESKLRSEPVFSLDEIKSLVIDEYKKSGSSIIPSESSIMPRDYCYNRINSGKEALDFNKKIFELIRAPDDEDKFRYLGKNFPYNGEVRHKPRSKLLPEAIVGEWDKGKFTPNDYGKEVLEKVKKELENKEQHTPPLNQILYGPPGTGKTYATTELAVEIVNFEFYDENKNHFSLIKEQYDKLIEEQRIVFTTFHQSFAYEDFIEGIRATTDDNGNLRYDVVDGIFKKLCKNASSTPNLPYLLIIDEINRGNISRIFGELITLLEPSKRKGQADARSVVLPYSKDKEPFSVPNNVFVIGTMNTADKSLAPLDLALRRRFSFIETPPNPKLLSTVNVHGVNMKDLLTVINERIEAILDRDHLIGHAYFMDLINSNDKVEDLVKIFKNKIIPLLQEYFFDDWERIGWVLNDSEKDDGSNFIQKGGDKKISKLFPNKPEENLPEDRRYRVNSEAFKNPVAYERILGKD